MPAHGPQAVRDLWRAVGQRVGGARDGCRGVPRRRGQRRRRPPLPGPWTRQRGRGQRPDVRGPHLPRRRVRPQGRLHGAIRGAPSRRTVGVVPFRVTSVRVALVNPERDLDVVVFGATGVTGRQVARYLAETGRQLGRPRGATRRSSSAPWPRSAPSRPRRSPPTSATRASLAAMAARAKVVLNLVGPYTTRGRPVIEACVDAGTHYVDLTGEIPFVREIVADFDVAAAEARGQGRPGLRVRGAAARPRRPVRGRGRARALGRRARAGRRDDRDHRPAARDAAPLRRDLRRHLPEHGRGGRLRRPERAHRPRGADRRPAGGGGGPRAQPDRAPPAPGRERRGDRADEPGGVHQPGGDPPHRGRDGGRARGRATSRSATARGSRSAARRRPCRCASAPPRCSPATQVGVRAAAGATPAVRARVAGGLRRVLPSSGFGPAADRLEPWRWRLVADATAAGGRPRPGRGSTPQGHPGYLTTARMLGEAGPDARRAGAPRRGRYGCVTPALALGTGALERFERAGLSFSVD